MIPDEPQPAQSRGPEPKRTQPGIPAKEPALLGDAPNQTPAGIGRGPAAMTEAAPAPVEIAPHITVLVGLRGFPLAATKSDDIEGRDFDQYDTAEEHAENFVIPQWFPIASWRGKVIYDGFCSTYREWHIMLRGFFAGLRIRTWDDLPKCPVLWQDEAQYYEPAAAVAYDLKRGSQGAIIGGILTAIPILKAIGVI